MLRKGRDMNGKSSWRRIGAAGAAGLQPGKRRVAEGGTLQDITREHFTEKPGLSRRRQQSKEEEEDNEEEAETDLQKDLWLASPLSFVKENT